MRALVIGRGSMGKRRIRDLTALGVSVESWDKTDGVLIPTGPFDVFVVCTPPDQHQIHGLGPHFIEAGVESVSDGGAWFYPSATPLFTDWYGLFRRLVDGEVEPSAYTLHVGQHLDDWHPGADPATYYAYRGDLAIREMVPFELIWLTRLFGPVSSTRACLHDRFAQVLVAHGPVCGHIFIDTLSRPPVRRFTLVSDGWTQAWDLEYTEAAYLAEIRAFVEAVEGRGQWPYSQSEEFANLNVLRMIERAG